MYPLMMAACFFHNESMRKRLLNKLVYVVQTLIYTGGHQAKARIARPPCFGSEMYHSLAGALQYMTFTRPDVVYVVQQVCLFMHDPREVHMIAIKRILCYIQGKLDHDLHLYPLPTASLVAYNDADWGGCPDTHRFTFGHCVFLGDNLISWSSKRQTTLSRSSAEAEYRGVANIVSESCWLRNLLLERRLLFTTINISTIYLSRNPLQHQRTKHIEMNIHFV